MERQFTTLKESGIHFQLQLPDESKLQQCRKLVKMLKHVWDFMFAVSSCIDNWKQTPWKKINVEDMETECKRFSKEMRNFEKEMKTLKPYTETEAIIKNLLTSLRAITELQNPAIRERHWIELMHKTKVKFICNVFKLSFIQFMIKHQNTSLIIKLNVIRKYKLELFKTHFEKFYDFSFFNKILTTKNSFTNSKDIRFVTIKIEISITNLKKKLAYLSNSLILSFILSFNFICLKIIVNNFCNIYLCPFRIVR